MAMMMMTMRLVGLYMVLGVSLMCSVVLVIHIKPEEYHVNSSDCRVGYGCIPTTDQTSSSSSTGIRSRKLLLHSNAEQVFKSFVPEQQQQQQQQQKSGHGNVNGYWSSLRLVPSGPDPLHHNGSGNKKPVNGYWSSLRYAPSGPDPLHHNGSGHKKPEDP